jgi:hypothetical protein
MNRANAVARGWQAVSFAHALVIEGSACTCQSVVSAKISCMSITKFNPF